jgi:hypothetical protein
MVYERHYGYTDSDVRYAVSDHLNRNIRGRRSIVMSCTRFVKK